MTTKIDGPRACRPDERAEMIAMVDGIMRAGTVQSMLTDYPLVYQDRNLPNVQIIKVNEQIASVVPFIPHQVEIDGCRFSIGIISPTATHPAHRKKGYARLCLERCVQVMEESEIDLSVLWTLVPTFEFYRHAEYQAIVEQHAVYLLRSSDAARFIPNTDLIDILDPRREDDLNAIRRLHEQDIFGIHRPAEHYSALFSLPYMTTWLARCQGRITGYLVVSRATNKPGLIEAGGEEAAIASLIHHALSQLTGDESVRAHVNHAAHALGRLLDQTLPGRRQPGAAGHAMIRINRPVQFLKNIAPLIGAGLATKLASSGLSRSALTAAIFGAHPEMPADVPKELFVKPPFYFPIWMLDHS